MIAENQSAPELDAGLLLALRRVLHEGIARYGYGFSYAQLLAYAQRLGDRGASPIFAATPSPEKVRGRNGTEISKRINPAAAGFAEDDSEGWERARNPKARAARA